MRFGQPGVQGQDSGLAPESDQGQKERDGRPARGRRHLPHGLKAVVAAAALQRAEAKQDRDRAEVRHQEVEIARAADLRVSMITGDQEVGRQRHRLPAHHEEVGVVGQQQQRHAGKEQVVVKALQPGRRAFAFAEVAAREQRHPGRHRTEQQQEECGQGVETGVERQVGQAQRQHSRQRRFEDRRQRHGGERQASQCADRKQHSADEADARGCQQAGQAEAYPDQGQAQCRVEGI